MEVDYVADVVCPWCYVGWSRLKRTFALRPGVEPHIRWRPYQLNPELPEEGVDRKALMASKFGADPARFHAMQQNLSRQAAEDGLDLKFEQISKSPNTNAAHRLIAWADMEEKGPEIAEAIMRAYFTELRDIGDHTVLADIAAEHGMDREMVAERFTKGAGKDFIDQACAMAAQAGVQGVPFMIFADRIAISGAHAPEDLVQAIDKAMEPAPAS
jgi:predicted DsbA family dithiol-disulfide isomerase